MGGDPERGAAGEGAADRRRRAYGDGRAAASRGEEAAPGCTTTPEGRAFLQGYVDGARKRAAAPDRQAPGQAR